MAPPGNYDKPFKGPSLTHLRAAKANTNKLQEVLKSGAAIIPWQVELLAPPLKFLASGRDRPSALKKFEEREDSSRRKKRTKSTSQHITHPASLPHPLPFVTALLQARSEFSAARGLGTAKLPDEKLVPTATIPSSKRQPTTKKSKIVILRVDPARLWSVLDPTWKAPATKWKNLKRQRDEYEFETENDYHYDGDYEYDDYSGNGNDSDATEILATGAGDAREELARLAGRRRNDGKRMKATKGHEAKRARTGENKSFVASFEVVGEEGSKHTGYDDEW
ncbi:hypothetical protein QBC35DRAFT_184036 [Podospora australis]|uniref:Uncharacterized protein n=1 Tax=Podospora australis TaxID=1536484 RepID=A0AAN6WIY1_9PEZI|nr:hypothetical protein QBC35DRAFT_184036 [Podospora australis]